MMLKPATYPRDNLAEGRLLVIDPAQGLFSERSFSEFASLLRPGDLVVVNDGATMPASLEGLTDEGAVVEARLISHVEGGRFSALLFGEGDYRMRTEDRPPPPMLVPGDSIRFGTELAATVDRLSPLSPRLVELVFREQGAALWSALYRAGRPIQYSYVSAPLEMWHVQTRYASVPVCAELPSAGRPLSWGMLLAWQRRGVDIATLTHAAGLSSTGDPGLDAFLPLPERFEIPEVTVRAVLETRARGGRVIAVGTTVVRALEGCYEKNGELIAGAGATDLVIRRGFHPRVVDGLLSGMHEPEESHFHILEAFAPPELVRRATAHAASSGYLGHEFGDSTLILG